MRSMEQKNLLYYIGVVSFCALEAGLFLDTHPEDAAALRYYKRFNEEKKQAEEEYSRRFGPLRLDQITDKTSQWQWAVQPWPWEGGEC